MQYVRAVKIARDYAANHETAKDIYRASGRVPEPAVSSLDQIGVRMILPGDRSPLMSLPDDYLARVDQLSREVDARFAFSDHCMFLPAVDRSALPERTADVPAIKAGEIISLQLKNASALPGLQTLCDAVLPDLERHVFGSFVIVDKVYVYRNLTCRLAPQVSWLWHYDNHPTEVLKVMIYLTDVTERTAPLEYLRNQDTKAALSFTPKPLLGNSRVSPAQVERYMREGYEPYKATGPKGTLIVFDDNVLHRANFAEERYRDVLVLQIRPATFAPDQRIDPRWTGSFEHVDFNPHPSNYTPAVKRRRLSY